MDVVINRHAESLRLPVGGPKLVPGVPTKVKRWRIIKGHAVVKAWLQASVIEEAEEVVTAPEMAPVAAPEPAGDDLAALRAEYRAKLQKQPYHGWGAETLRAKIDAVA